jgi:hypothetical protein
MPAQLVEGLRYKPADREVDSRWGHLDLSMTNSFRPHYGPGVDSASDRNEYQVYVPGGYSRRVPRADNLAQFMSLSLLEP